MLSQLHTSAAPPQRRFRLWPPMQHDTLGQKPAQPCQVVSRDTEVGAAAVGEALRRKAQPLPPIPRVRLAAECGKHLWALTSSYREPLMSAP